MYIADAHCDTLSGMLDKEQKFSDNDLQIDQNLLSAASEEGYLQFFAMFSSPSRPAAKNMEYILGMNRLFDKMTESGFIRGIRSKKDIGHSGISGLLAVEGIYFANGDTDVIDSLFENGVRCMSLTWNPDNEFSGGILGETGKGLSEKGREIIKRAFDMGMAVDVSHISDNGFYDIAEIAGEYGKPFAATHSNSRRLCSHMRNLDDDMLRTIADAGGFAGINMYSCFLNDSCEADADDVIRHIEYMCGLTGPDYIGFGSDFDGIDIKRSALENPAGIPVILERLLRLNYSESDVRKIASGNILRFLNNILPEG